MDCTLAMTRFPLALALLIFLSAMFPAGCTRDDPLKMEEQDSGRSDSGDGDHPFTDNQTAQQTVEGIDLEIKSKAHASHEQVVQLVDLNRLYPNTPEIIEPLITAFVVRKDWLAICELYRTIDRGLVNDGLYVRSLILSMSFGEAVAFLEQQPERELEDNFLLGYSLYHNGNFERAIEVMDEVIEVPSEKSGEALMICGLAAIQLDDWDTADSMLARSMEEAPDNVVAITAMARVKRKTGEDNQAEMLENQAIELRNNATSREASMHQMSSLGAMLNEAWTNREFDKCRDIIGRMKPDADAKTRAALDNYLLSIDRLQGN